MEVKKTPRADLERGRPMRLLISLLAVLVLFFVVLEWEEADPLADFNPELWKDEYENEIVQVSEIPEEAPLIKPPASPPVQSPPVEKPPLELPKFTDLLEVVDNRLEITDTLITDNRKPEAGLQTQQGAEQADMEEAWKREEPQTDEEKVYKIVDALPEFPGGINAMMRYITQHTVYPQEAFDKGIQGKVMIQFVVNTDGTLADFKILEHAHLLLDEEALRVMRSMPAWKPGRWKNKPVRALYKLPFIFRTQ